MRETEGVVQGALITAVLSPAFLQAIGMLRPKGTLSLVGLPRGNFATPIFDVVLKRLTIRGSIVGMRKDLSEAIAFAAGGKVKATVERAPLAEINTVFTDLKRGAINGRIVLDFA